MRSLSTGEKRIGPAVQKPHNEILIFAALMFEFILLRPNVRNMDDIMATLYFLSYQDMGFNERFLIGSIVRMFSGYISSSALFYGITVVITCFNAFVALLLGKVIRSDKDNHASSKKVFLLLLLASPFSVSFLYDKWNFGYVDIYLIIITFVMIFIINNKHLVWLLPVCCFIALAIHPAWVFLYMPAVAVLSAYRCYKDRLKKSTVIVCVTALLTTILSVIYFQFFSPALNFAGPVEVVDFLSQRTDLTLSKYFIMAQYYIKDGSALNADLLKMIKHYALPYSISALVVTAPLTAVFIALWLRAFKLAKDKLEKLIIFSCMAAPAVTLPMFLQLDWDRWICAIIIVQFSLVFYFLYDGFECVEQSAEMIRVFLHRHLLLFVSMIIYLSTMLLSVARPLFYFLQQDMVGFYYSMLEKHLASFG